MSSSAAVNFGQYDNGGYFPYKPTKIIAKIPEENTKEMTVSCLPEEQPYAFEGCSCFHSHSVSSTMSILCRPSGTASRRSS